MPNSGSDYNPRDIEESAGYIRRQVEAAGRDKVAVALQIGAHILKKFFGGSPHAFTHKGNNSPSFRALSAHPDVASLSLSHRTLAYYISLAIQDEQWDGLIAKERLPSEAKTLGYTQRLRLLPTKSTKDLVRIVKTVLEQDLGVAEIAALVKEANAVDPAQTRRREAEEVVAAKKALAAGRQLLETDWTGIDDEDLVSASTLVDAAASATSMVRDKIDGERASRGLQAPTVPTALAADTPDALDELDELVNELTGEDLGLGGALRKDAAHTIRQHGERIIDNLAWADEDTVKQWFVPFAAEIAKQLGAEGELAQACSQMRHTARQYRGSKWFLVQAHDPIPTEDLTFNTFLDQTHNPRRDSKCVVQAADADDAVNKFLKAIGNLDPDVGVEHRVFAAEPLKETLHGRGTVKAYLAKPRNERQPTLGEYFNELSRATD